MAQYSEATQRVFDRTLELLEGKLDQKQLEAIRALVAAGEFNDLAQLETILASVGDPDAD